MPHSPEVGDSLSAFAARVAERALVARDGGVAALPTDVAVHVHDPAAGTSLDDFLLGCGVGGDSLASVVAVPVDALENDPVTELRDRLDSLGHAPMTVGWAPSATDPQAAEHVVAVISPFVVDRLVKASDDFTVLAVVTAFNESDIIRSTVLGLLAQGIDVVVVDNWSTDGTAECIDDLVAEARVRVLRHPEDGPSEEYDWAGLLRRVESIAAESNAAWVVHHDSDQRHDGPWAGLNYRDALCTVDRMGFTAVDHTVVDFRPTPDRFEPGGELDDHFRHFEFDHGATFAVHVQAWKNLGRVDLASSGGHDADFDGRCVFPFDFVIRHYGIRSQEHGERKVFRERRPRYRRAELDRGWHDHYYRFSRRHRFVRDPETLLEYRPDRFREDYPLQLLGRAGIREGGPSPRRFGGLRRVAVVALRTTGLLKPLARARNAVRTATR